ncbi:MAG: hypothetical protein VX911_10705 [Candidatus Latescibacterota bacterium]|nr:hypothetical protein [Candidatus Latescibacterota bacterium]
MAHSFLISVAIRTLTALVVVVGSSFAAEARTTFTAVFQEEAIAGPGIEQRLILLLRYFPGDGEAVVRCELSFESAALDIEEMTSALGSVELGSQGLVIDYASAPLASESVDTLEVRLTAGVGEAQVKWEGGAYSSQDADGEAAQTIRFSLGVHPALGVSLSWKPERAFPGQSVDLQIAIRNADDGGREIKAITWKWPEGMDPEKGSDMTVFPKGLSAGQDTTVIFRIRLEASPGDTLLLTGSAASAQLAGSPLPKIAVAIVEAPRVRLIVAEGTLEVGEPGRLAYEWYNPGSEAIEVEAYKVDIPQGFSAVASVVEAQPSPLVTVHSADGQATSLVMEGGILDAGAATGLSLVATPLRPGPFRWHGSFMPEGHDQYVPLTGDTSVGVAQPEAKAAEQVGTAKRALTDLESVGLAFRGEVMRELADLPLVAGSRIYLKPEQDERNWIVTDILSRSLRHLGYRVVMEEPAALGDVSVLHYRVVDARVVYSPSGGVWNPFGTGQQREAFGDVFLHLERSEGRFTWARRVQAYRVDSVPSGESGESGAVSRAIIPRSHRVVELGLSGAIAGGLFFVFFSP